MLSSARAPTAASCTTEPMVPAPRWRQTVTAWSTATATTSNVPLQEAVFPRPADSSIGARHAPHVQRASGSLELRCCQHCCCPEHSAASHMTPYVSSRRSICHQATSCSWG